tara:strand:+ start:468 stop:599 length:132 start_codon:yes stop_codon:yes gene_type:complete
MTNKLNEPLLSDDYDDDYDDDDDDNLCCCLISLFAGVCYFVFN